MKLADKSRLSGQAAALSLIVALAAAMSPAPVSAMQADAVQAASATIAVPSGAVVTEVITYADKRLNGLQLSYVVPATGETGMTDLMGSDTGNRRALPLNRGDALDYITVYSDAAGVKGLSVWFVNGGGYDIGGRGSIVTELRPQPGQAFWGFSGKAGGNVQTLALASGPARGGGQMAYQQPAPARTAAAPRSPAIAQQAGNTDGGSTSDDFSSPAPAPASAPTAAPRIAAQGDGPMRQAAASQAAAPQRAEAQAGASAASASGSASLRGLWLDTAHEDPIRPADMTRSAEFVAPRYINIISDANGLYIMPANFTSDPKLRIPLMTPDYVALDKQADGTFSAKNVGTAIVQTSAGTGMTYLVINLTSPRYSFMSGKYRMTMLPDKKTLTRDRFDPEILGARKDANEMFSGAVSESNIRASLNGHDVIEMRPDDPDAGMRDAIFTIDPSQKAYAYDGNFGKFIPYGLRAYANKKAASTEVTISMTSEADIQRGASEAVGVGVMGFGLSFSKEQAKGLAQKTSSTHQMSFNRTLRYTFINDLPNTALNPVFKDRIQEFAANPTAQGARSIIDTYGTHYAQGITYGANTKCEEDVYGEESTATLMTKYGADAQGSVKEVSLSVSKGSQTDSRNGSSFSNSSRVCAAVGGRGIDAGSSTDDDDVVPLLYDLRPLDQLINMVNFPTTNNGEIKKLSDARIVLHNAIYGYVSDAGTTSDRLFKPWAPPQEVYKVHFTSMRCTNSGIAGAPDTAVKVLGKISIKLTDARGDKTVDVFDTKNDDKKPDEYTFEDMTCGASATPKPLDKTELMIKAGGVAKTAQFVAVPVGLYKFTPLANRTAENVGATFLKLPAGGYWILAKIVDGIGGEDAIVKGGLANGLYDKIDGIKRDFLANSTPIFNKGADIYPTVPDAKTFAPESRAGVMELGGGTAPTLEITYETQRLQ